jgi:hypothetical protein
MSENAPPRVEQGSAPSAQASVSTWHERAGRAFTALDRAIHSRRGVWSVVVLLFVVLVACTVGFLHFGWATVWIPLYAADVEMLVVASAIYVIAVTWDKKPR